MPRDPVLTPLATLRDDEVLFQAGKADLRTRCPHTASDDRPSTPVAVMLRRLVVKPFYGWSFPPTAHSVSDMLGLRQLCRGYGAPVPDQSPLHRWTPLLPPATRHRVLAYRVPLACQRQGTQGRTWRLDGTVVSTTSQPPTDRTLRSAGVRGLSRAWGKAATWLREGAVVTQASATHLAPQARNTMQRRMAVACQRGATGAPGSQGGSGDSHGATGWPAVASTGPPAGSAGSDWASWPISCTSSHST
jgi:hypothetical protein